MKKGISIFGGIKNPGFKQFILTANTAGVTPLILASQKTKENLIGGLLEYGIENDPFFMGTFYRLMMHQDNEGYSALM